MLIFHSTLSMWKFVQQTKEHERSCLAKTSKCVYNDFDGCEQFMSEMDWTPADMRQDILLNKANRHFNLKMMRTQIISHDFIATFLNSVTGKWLSAFSCPQFQSVVIRTDNYFECILSLSLATDDHRISVFWGRCVYKSSHIHKIQNLNTLK